MKTVDVGYLKDVSILQRSFDDYVVIDVSFGDMSVPNGLHNFDNERCYIVKKAELDVYMARKESLEHMNCTPVWDAYNQLKVKFNELESENADLRSKVKVLEDQKKRLSDTAVYWNNRFTSVMTDFGKVLAANGVAFSVKEIDDVGNWNVTIDIPELTEAKKKISELEQKLRLAKYGEEYWIDRKEEEEEYHHYWLHTYNLAVAHAANKGVRILMTGEDKENNVGDIWVKNEKAEELEVKIGELQKELDDLKSKKIEKCTLDPSDGKLTFIYTYMDGHEESTCIVDDVDPNGIPRDVTPKCSSCSHFMHSPSRSTHDWCYMPIPKEGMAGYIRKLSKEEAEGPACSDFKARKE